jgi:hypothetical protein
MTSGSLLPDAVGQHPPDGGQQQEHPGGPLPRHQVHQSGRGALQPRHRRQTHAEQQPNQTYETGKLNIQSS